MTTNSFCLATLLGLPFFGDARAQLITLEPDNYADNTVLNLVLPQVRLVTAGDNNLPIPFDVTAVTQTTPFNPPTGQRVFSHVGVPFFNGIRRLRMDFNGTVAGISIDFQGSIGETDQGRLDVYNSQNVLLDSFLTAPLAGGQTQTMSVTRLSTDIAYALAFTTQPNLGFGRLDHLVFSTPVPEPSTPLFLTLGALGLAGMSRRRKSAEQF